MTPTLFKFQEDMQEDLHNAIVVEGKSGVQVIMGTGFGKTYVAGSFLRRFQDTVLPTLDNVGPIPMFYVTAASVVEQTTRVLKEFGVKRCLVTNYDQLRASFGEMFLEWKTIVKNGSPTIEPFWDKDFAPVLILWDENQKLKNPGSLQHKVALGYVEQIDNGRSVFMSATPWGRPCETKVFALSTRKSIVHGNGISSPLNSHYWPSLITRIAYPKDPSENTPAGMRRFCDEFSDYILKAKGVRFKKKTHILCSLIDFSTPEEAQVYQNAYKEYLEKLYEAGRQGPSGIAAIWVAQLKFRMAAEVLRAPQLAQTAIEIVEKDKKQVLIASNFIDTLKVVMGVLIRKGIPRDRISYIVGGQTKEERQIEIDKFQKGDADFCLFTLRSGGVGLSLHHDRETTRPRHVLLPPTWSAIELVQALGRAHRINSLSDTYQTIVWYRGTVEEEVAAKVQLKLSCLGEVVGKQETWSNAFAKRAELDSRELNEKMLIEESTSEDEGEESCVSVSQEEVEAMMPEEIVSDYMIGTTMVKVNLI